MVTDLQLERIRAKKENELKLFALNYAHKQTKLSMQRSNQRNPWISSQNNMRDFINTWFPEPVRREDFPSYYTPTDDIDATAGTGSDTNPSFHHFEWLSEKRLGVCNNIASKPSEDAVRNRFRIADFKGQVDDKLTEKVMEWLEQPSLKFWNQLAQVLYYERVYGIGVLVKYYTKDDKKKNLLKEKAPKNKKPIAFQAFPPTIISPIDVHKSVYLDSDPREWTWHGGKNTSLEIHPTRCQVFRTRPTTTRWWGQSLFEAIWLQLLLYFEIFVFMLRHFTKWGGVIPKYMVDTTDDLEDVFSEYADLLDEMKMNGAFVGIKGDELDFAPTNTALGLTELMELLKEEIAARVRIPVMVIFGRISNAGLGSAGYLLAQMEYWGEVANIQQSISDDVFDILKAAGFKLNKRRVDWILAINKTDQQRLIDEGMKIENEIMKEQYIQAQITTMMMLEQAQSPQKTEEIDKDPSDNNPSDNNGGKAKLELEVSAKQKDFIDKRDTLFESIKLKRKERIAEYLKNLEGS